MRNGSFPLTPAGLEVQRGMLWHVEDVEDTSAHLNRESRCQCLPIMAGLVLGTFTHFALSFRLYIALYKGSWSTLNGERVPLTFVGFVDFGTPASHFMKIRSYLDPQPFWRQLTYRSRVSPSRIWRTVILAIALTNSSSESASAQCIDYNDSAHWVGGLELPETPTDIAVSANFAYVTNGTVGLHVIDITQSQDPALVSTVRTLGRAENIAISGNYAYVAETQPWSGIQVIDISDPTSPQIVESFRTTNGATRVAISENYAYVGGYGVLSVVDITNPRALQTVGTVYTSFEGPPTSNITVSGSYAYLSDGFRHQSPIPIGLRHYVIDVSNPRRPQIVGKPNVAVLAISGDYAYGLGPQFHVLDISIPTDPRIVGSVDTPGARRLAVWGNHVYVLGHGLDAIDISVPTNPIIVGRADAPRAAGLAVTDNHAYVVGSGLQVIDIAKPEGANLVSLGFGRNAIGCGLDASGNQACVIDFGDIDEPQNMRVIDISNSAQPVIVGRLWTSGFIAGGFPWDVTMSGAHVYVSTSVWSEYEGHPNYLQVIDISTPTSPRKIGRIKTPRSAIDIEVSAGFAYLADRSADIQVVDVSIPSNPQIVGIVKTSGEANGIAIADNLTYVADGTSGLVVFDMTAPLNPRLVGHVDTPGEAMDLAITGSLALLADGPAGLHVIDIMDPSRPQILSSVGTLNAQNIAVSGSNAYVVDKYDDFFELSGLQVIDISNPHRPRTIVRRYAQNPVRVAVSGEHVYVAGGYEGYASLQVLPLQCEAPRLPPIASAGGPYLGECHLPLTFDATGSSAQSGDVVSYEWDWNGDSEFDEMTASPIATHTYETPFMGTVRLRVSDDQNPPMTSESDAQVTITDTKAPQITTIEVLPDVLWHKSQQMVTLELKVEAKDLCDSDPTSRIVKIEPDPPSHPDHSHSVRQGYEITDALSLQLPLDFSQGREGHLYRVTVTSCDEIENASAAVAEIRVAFDHGRPIVRLESLTMDQDAPVDPRTDGAASRPDGIPEMAKSSPSAEAQHGFGLVGIFPNPMGSQGQVKFSLATESQVQLAIYDVRGRLVRTLARRNFLPGLHSAHWETSADDGSVLSQGIYFVRLDVARKRFTQRFVVLR